MSKTKTVFECTSCGARFPKWVGKCTDCGGWNTVEEIREEAKQKSGGRAVWSPDREAQTPVPLAEVQGTGRRRSSTTIDELDRVLGGGIVEGSAILVGGDPGIGKSTLLLKLMMGLAGGGLNVLYVTGEESARQIRMRADRLGGPPETLYVQAETAVENIIGALEKMKPAAAVVDSVQTLYSADLSGAPGTVSQVREVSARLVSWAKAHGMPLFLVGHVTKDGSLAGPRVLEHMVDTVLYFEGDKGLPVRILRATKNRFGSTNEVGVFEMREEGLKGVSNPSELFLSERPLNAPGSAVVPCLEGTRPLLVEIQALVAPQAFGAGQRTTSGIERNKVQILIALLDRKIGYSLAGHDVFVSVAGGMEIGEPAGDLGIVAALMGAYVNRPLPSGSVFFGEVGLAGEVRAVSGAEDRIREAAKLGFTSAWLPQRQAASIKAPKGFTLNGVSSVAQFADSVGF